MNDLDNIFENIVEYKDHIDDLIKTLRLAGIKNFEEFMEVARRVGEPVPKTIREQVADKFANVEEDDWEEVKNVNTEESYQRYLDTYSDGKYRNEARDQIEKLQTIVENRRSDEIWNGLDKGSILELQNFVDHYPTNLHIEEAKNLLKELRRAFFLGVGIKALIRQIKIIQADKQINNPEKVIYEKIVSSIKDNKIRVEELLTAIAEDNNLISGTIANLLWENGIITDFSQTGISEDFITCMISNIRPQGFQAPVSLTKITKSSCTEVYFWGIPSSGKTCALGAILSVANSGRIARSMQKDPDCQGYGYMTRLANLFKTNGVGTLPEGTPISATYEMGFILEDENQKEHPITCIDLAGELVRCMYKEDAGEPLTEEQRTVLKTLTNILIDNRTNNRKIHFFVIEYGAEDREYEGLPQKDYLEAAVAYIQRTGIFKKDTDGLYLLITKVDKAQVKGKELEDKLRLYLSENYLGFYNGLKKVCKDNEINRGIVEIQPFTLGKVCFQNYCKFEDESAVEVVRTLIKRSYGYKPGKWNNFLTQFKK